MGKIKFTLNGQSEETPIKTSIHSLVLKYKFNPNLIIVEYNQQILKQNQYNETFIQPNDTVEIIRYIGGGKI